MDYEYTPLAKNLFSSGNIKDRQSTVWFMKLFDKGKTKYDDMPSWYSNDTDQKMIPRSSIMSESNESFEKPVVAAVKASIFLKSPECALTNLDEKLIISLRECNSDTTKVTLELVGGYEKPGEIDLQKWICKPNWNNWLAQHPIGNRSSEPMKNKYQLYREKIDQRCKETLALLLEKLENGMLLPSSIWRNSDNRIHQYGIDNSPTASESLMMRKEEEENDYIEELKAQEERTKKFAELVCNRNTCKKEEDGKALFFPVMDLDIEDYIKEPTANYLLRKVGALNENGYLTCELKDFNEVQHCVRRLLIEWADRIKHQPPHQEFQYGFKKDKHIHPKTPTQYSVNKRAQLLNVLKEEMHKKKSKSITLPSVDFLNNDINDRRGLKSFPPEQIEEVVSRLKIGMDRKSNLLPDEFAPSMLEILPFEYRSSFDDEDHPGLVSETVKFLPKRNSLEDQDYIKWPIYAEYHDGELEVIQKRFLRKAQLEAPALKMAQWENRKLVEDLSGHADLSEKEQNLMLIIKYFVKWSEIIKDSRAWRNYYPFEHKNLWSGPYPQFALEQIRDLDGESNYEPTSTKDFFGKYKKVQNQMFDKVNAILERYANGTEEEEPLVEETDLLLNEDQQTDDIEDYSQPEEAEEEEYECTGLEEEIESINEEEAEAEEHEEKILVHSFKIKTNEDEYETKERNYEDEEETKSEIEEIQIAPKNQEDDAT